MHCHLHSKGSVSQTCLSEDISIPFLSGSQGGGSGGVAVAACVAGLVAAGSHIWGPRGTVLTA